MRLSQLITRNDTISLHGGDCEVTSITADSRQVTEGSLFIAIPGTKHDGREFVDDAIKRGARAVLLPGQLSLPPTVTQLTTGNVRLATAKLAALFYPEQPETIVAITGTSGKTSTAQFTRELWQIMGQQSASIGTLGYISATESLYGSLTTPDAITLHQMLSKAALGGVTHLAMEASSHGLDLHRLDAVRLQAGGFTNLSRDHLDYHQTMENYLAAKMRLFSTLLPTGAYAVLNADDQVHSTIEATAKAHGLKVFSYGKNGKEIKILSIKPQASQQIISAEIFGTIHEIPLPVMGEFQAWNAMLALGLTIATGSDAGKAVQALSQLRGVPGRLQHVGNTKSGGVVFVDYAHKPDALENVLSALRPHVAAHNGAQLSVVFGCGGNRDKGKRPIMGEIAQRLADSVIVTDDNPRHENPATIRQEVLQGCRDKGNVLEIGDRANAIAEAIRKLKQHDVLVIAGKGHESGQIIGDETHPFDDADIARKVIEA